MRSNDLFGTDCFIEPSLFHLFQPKGKQGTKGPKQIHQENESTLQFYFYVCLAVNVSNSLIDI